jgi:hypothetical protein
MIGTSTSNSLSRASSLNLNRVAILSNPRKEANNRVAAVLLVNNRTNRSKEMANNKISMAKVLLLADAANAAVVISISRMTVNSNRMVPTTRPRLLNSNSLVALALELAPVNNNKAANRFKANNLSNLANSSLASLNNKVASSSFVNLVSPLARRFKANSNLVSLNNKEVPHPLKANNSLVNLVNLATTTRPPRPPPPPALKETRLVLPHPDDAPDESAALVSPLLKALKARNKLVLKAKLLLNECADPVNPVNLVSPPAPRRGRSPRLRCSWRTCPSRSPTRSWPSSSPRRCPS